MSRNPDSLAFGSSDVDHRQNRQRKEKTTLAGAAVNLPLGIIKVVVGYFGHSQALLADGVDSLLDVLSAALVIGAVRIGAKSADHDHPYGHARIETAATVLLSVVMVSSGVWIAWAAIQSLVGAGQLVEPGWLALGIAVLSLGLKEGLFWYTLVQSRRARSPLLAANAWNYQADAVSSALAVVAIAGSMAGLSFLDPIGAILIALMLIGIGVRYAWDSLRELVDTGLSPDRIAFLREQISQVPGVCRMRRLRTRTMGGHQAYADVGVLVDPYISLTEAHRISEAITERVLSRVEEIADITIHIEPDGHEDVTAAYHLPLREEILERMQAAWAHLPIANYIEHVTLHYLDDAVEAYVVLPLEQVESVADAATIRNAFAQVTTQVQGVRSIQPLFR